MGQQSDAARQIPLNRHLLDIQQSHLLPSRSVARRRGRKASVQIGGHRKRHGDQLIRIQSVLFHQCVHQLGDGLADGLCAVLSAGCGAAQASQQPRGRHGLYIQRGWPLSSSSVVSN